MKAMSIRNRLLISYLAVTLILSAVYFLVINRIIINYVIEKNYTVFQNSLAMYNSNSIQMTESSFLNVGELLTVQRIENIAQKLSLYYSNHTNEIYEPALSESAMQIINSTIFSNNVYYSTVEIYFTNGIPLNQNATLESSDPIIFAKENPEIFKLITEADPKKISSNTFVITEAEAPESSKKFLATIQIENTPFVVCATLDVDEYCKIIDDNVTLAAKPFLNKMHSNINANSQFIQLQFRIISVACVFFMLIISMIFSIWLSNTINRPIMRLLKGVRLLGFGNFNFTVPELGPPEIAILAKSFNRMEERLHNYMTSLKQETAARKVFENDVNVVRDIQQSLLPHDFPPFPDCKEIELHASLKPATLVAGDFFDFFFVDKNKLVFLVGDVSGKSMPAAFFMAMTCTLLRSESFIYANLAEILTTTNRILAANNDTCMFATLFIAYYDTQTGELSYANAGHHSALIVSPSGMVKSFGLLEDPPLGLYPSHRFRSGRIILKKDEKVFLYTDGVTEAHSPNLKLFGMERLLAFLKEHVESSCQNICEALTKELEHYQDNNIFDDITLLSLKKCNDNIENPEIKESELHMIVSNSNQEIPTLIFEMEKFLEPYNLDHMVIYDIILVLEEIIVNIIDYAYPKDELHTFSVRIEIKDEFAYFTIRDDGIPFNPLEKEDPNLELPIENREIGGLGILMIKQIMQNIKYKRKLQENILTFQKKLY